MEKELSILRNILAADKQAIVGLRQEVTDLQNHHHDLSRDFCLGIISVLDSFESKEGNLSLRYEADEQAQRVIKSYSSIKKQLLGLLAKHGVTQLEFPDGRLPIGFAKVIDTEPAPGQENDTIVGVVKPGYVRGSQVVREAEVIVVRN